MNQADTSPTSGAPAGTPMIKPQNGIAGLRHWRHDLVAGLIVSIVSLPLSLGIAVASGAPPITGVVSAIIAGLIFPLIGGSYVTISGPAAGLAPALLAGMTILGGGDLAKGYPLLLVAIFLAGCVQVVLSLAKAARFAAIFPTAVVEGMLASIGLLIIIKQLPQIYGVKFEAHEFFEYLVEAPRRVAEIHGENLGIALACLVLLFAFAGKIGAKLPLIRRLPPQLTVVVIGVLLGIAFGLDPKYLVPIPDDILKNGMQVPHFGEVFTNHDLWLPVLGVVITLTLIDGVESLATAAAIDKIDPFKRRSEPNRTLLAMALSNMASSLIGGLTIIPGGVKSKVNIVAGGRTLWANFSNAIFLILFLSVAKDAIRLIPLPALAAVLIFTGWKMCEPKVWRHMAHSGREELLVFSLTILATLLTDLLWGIVIGTLIQLFVDAYFTARTVGSHRGEESSVGEVLGLLPKMLGRMCASPIGRTELDGTDFHVHLNGPLVCFNTLKVSRALDQVPAEAKRVVFHFSDQVSIVDHTTCDNLAALVEERAASGRGTLELDGFDAMRRTADGETSMRVAA